MAERDEAGDMWKMASEQRTESWNYGGDFPGGSQVRLRQAPPVIADRV
ncbi:MAG: hypothetical protein K2O34_03845 [Acetatifactor sp.]|nr:hypothetical protein [Acetatifactor sp.]